MKTLVLLIVKWYQSMLRRLAEVFVEKHFYLPHVPSAVFPIGSNSYICFSDLLSEGADIECFRFFPPKRAHCVVSLLLEVCRYFVRLEGKIYSSGGQLTAANGKVITTLALLITNGKVITTLALSICVNLLMSIWWN